MNHILTTAAIKILYEVQPCYLTEAFESPTMKCVLILSVVAFASLSAAPVDDSATDKRSKCRKFDLPIITKIVAQNIMLNTATLCV